MLNALILVVLIVIAVVLAPWLIGLLAAAAAVYGVYVVALGALIATAVLIGGAWGIIASMRKTQSEAAAITGGRVSCNNCQAEVSDQLEYCDNCHHKL